MKKAILTFALFLSAVSVNAQPTTPVGTKSTLDYRKQGIIYQLTIYKATIETALGEKLAQSARKKDSANAIAEYLKLKAKSDAAITQFIFELNQKHRLVKKFNKINRGFMKGGPPKNLSNKYLNALSLQLDDYINSSATFIPSNSGGGLADFDVFGALDVLNNILTGQQEFRSKKVEGLTKILQGLMLSPIEGIGKSKKDE